MKVVFLNPPVIRSATSSPENDFAIKEFVFKKEYLRVKGSWRMFSLLHKIFGLGNDVRYGVRAGSRWPFTQDRPMNYAPYPFFMGYSASLLRKNGVEVNILDAVAEGEYDYSRFLGAVKEERADIAVLECSTPTLDIDLWFAEKVAAFADVALAGPHLNDSTISEILAKTDKIKFFLCGEYIYGSLNMVRSLSPGVYSSEVVENLDLVPFPFREYSSATKYFDPSMPTPRPQLQIYGSKGCPFKCSFCAWPQTMYFGKVALRSPERIVEEIEECVSKFGYRSIFFDDDTFNLGTERISRLCDLLGRIALPWTMMGRLDCSPNWLYDKMAASGCVGMRFGIETFDLDVLKRVNKGLERMDFKSTLEYISVKYPDIMIHLTMMKDMPGMTEDAHRRDMEILKDMGYSTSNIYRSYQLSCCVPFPGTQLYKEMQSQLGETLSNYAQYDGGQKTVMSEMP